MCVRTTFASIALPLAPSKIPSVRASIAGNKKKPTIYLTETNGKKKIREKQKQTMKERSITTNSHIFVLSVRSPIVWYGVHRENDTLHSWVPCWTCVDLLMMLLYGTYFFTCARSRRASIFCFEFCLSLSQFSISHSLSRTSYSHIHNTSHTLRR